MTNGSTPGAESQFPSDILARIQDCGIIAVLVIEQTKHAVPVARALLAGGISVIELTLRTPVALDGVRSIVAEVPDMVVGVGTILTVQQVQEVSAAGAAFGVSPGMNRRVVEAAQVARLPFAPGVATPSDIEAAVELGCRDLKFFPAEPSGGLAYLTSAAAPYQHLGIRFIPLGGLNQENAATYLGHPLVRAVGGSWLAPSSLILAEDWAAITDRAAAARKIVESVRTPTRAPGGLLP